ncbi:hypothetical protein NKH12_06420, partial [Mesorhizobium sp. M1322]
TTAPTGRTYGRKRSKLPDANHCRQGAVHIWIALMTLGLGSGSSPYTVLVILAGCAVLSVTIFCGYAIVFSTAPMIRLYRRARHWIEGTLAVFFGFAGLKLLLTRI